jgi:hypothetical protein
MANIVLPKVRLFVPCLSIVLEHGKPRTITDPLHTIRMAPGENRYDLWCYAQLTDGVGQFRLAVAVYNEEGIIVGKSTPQMYDFLTGSQLIVRESKILLQNVPFARPGIYVFALLANHAHLEEGGTALLRVLPG